VQKDQNKVLFPKRFNNLGSRQIVANPHVNRPKVEKKHFTKRAFSNSLLFQKRPSNVGSIGMRRNFGDTPTLLGYYAQTTPILQT